MAAIVVLACGIGSASALSADGSRPRPPLTSPPPSDAEVLARFLARPDEPVRSFRARRHLEVSAPFGRKAWMDVLVELDPADGFHYRVLDAGGSEALREKVLLRVLRSEQQAYAADATRRTALTAENYALSSGGRDARGLVRLRAIPRRKESGLLDGEFLVTPDSAELVEVSGRLAKAPDFFVPVVEVRKRYQRIHGHRVTVEVESTSHLRLLASSRFSLTTRYEAIDGDEFATVAAAEPAGGP